MPEQEVVVIIQLSNYKNILQSVTFRVSLTCDEEPVIQDPDPSEVPDTIPIELSCVVGEVLDDPEQDEWYVLKQGYRLSKVEMWKDQYNTYGFEVTYTPEIPDAVGWYPETHLFGTKDRDDNFESLEIDY